MTAPDLPTTLRSLHACGEATAWAEGKDIATAWATCERTEWMLWWLRRCDFDREALNRCNLDCMAFALDAARPRNEGKPWWPAIVDAHDRVRRAIIENRSDLPAARRAAYAAAYAAAAYAAADAADAAYAAAYAAAAYATADAADAAAAAAYAAAAYAAADAADDAAADAAVYAAAAYAAAAAAVYAAAREGANYVLCAIIRKHFPTAPALKVTK